MNERPKEGALFTFFKRRAKLLARLSFRLPRFVGGFLFRERIFRHYCWDYIRSKLYYENIMNYRCKQLGKHFMLFGEIPFMEGDGNIYIGDNVKMQGHVVMFTGGHIYKDSEIRIGNNVSLGYAVLFRAAKQIVVGNNCMIASGVRISDNDGHVINAQRTGGEHTKVDPEDVKPVIIEDDVWIGEDSTILKGVTIGHGSIVSSGSVVTKSVPPMKIVMGNPARIAMWVPEKNGTNPAPSAPTTNDNKASEQLS
jgi:acetyltransferase-like isoleucine patch superfamily enzyme